MPAQANLTQPKLGRATYNNTMMFDIINMYYEDYRYSLCNTCNGVLPKIVDSLSGGQASAKTFMKQIYSISVSVCEWSKNGLVVVHWDRPLAPDQCGENPDVCNRTL